MMFYAAFNSIHAFPCFTSTRLGSKSVTKKPRGSLAYESNTLTTEPRGTLSVYRGMHRGILVILSEFISFFADFYNQSAKW